MDVLEVFGQDAEGPLQQAAFAEQHAAALEGLEEPLVGVQGEGIHLLQSA